jgi:hypothetical protein
MAQWHYVADNTKLGPCETAEIQTLIASGQLGASTPVWKKGLSTWIRLDTTELSQYLTGPPTISSLRPVTAGNPQVDVNLGGLERGVRVDSNVDVTLGVRSNSLAYIALVLTILGFFTILGFLPGLICGILALQQYKKDPSIGGNGAALAAVIISGLFIALGVLFGLGFVFLMILAAAVA